MAKYRIQKRYEVWVDKIIQADSLDEAFDVMRASTFDDFLTTKAKANVVDFTELSGAGVQEEW